jgi:CRP-like cAMP-binding protein
LLQDVPRTATVHTRTPTLLLVLKREQFLKLVATAPQVRQKVDAAIGHRLDVGYARGVGVRRTGVRQLETALRQ